MVTDGTDELASVRPGRGVTEALSEICEDGVAVTEAGVAASGGD